MQKLNLSLIASAMLCTIVLTAAGASANLFTNGSFEDQNPAVTDSRLPYLLNQQTPSTNQIGWMRFDPSQPSGDGIPWTGGPGSNYNDEVLPYNSVNGWTFVNAGEWDSSRVWVARDGEMSLDLNCQVGGGVYQMVNTIIGQEYKIKFYLSGNPYAGDPPAGTTDRKMEVVVGTGIPDAGTPGVSGTVLFNGTDSPLLSSSYTFDTSVIEGPSPYQDMQWEDNEITFTAVNTSTTVFFHSLMVGTSVGAVIDEVSIVPEPATLTLALMSAGGLAFLKRRKG